MPPGSVWRLDEERSLMSDVRKSPWRPAIGIKMGALCGAGAVAGLRIISGGGDVAGIAGVLWLIGGMVR